MIPGEIMETKKIEKVSKMAAQGDVLFRRVAEVPSAFKEQPASARIIVAHSETGHHHAIDSTGVRLFTGEDPLRCYLIIDGEFADVVHHRNFDTHATIRLGGGGAVYEVIRQREYTPEGWRRVQD